METHAVRAHPSKDKLPREEQLAWKIASVAIASLNRGPITSARAMA